MALPRVYAGRRRAVLLRLLANGTCQALLAFGVAWGVRETLAAVPSQEVPWTHALALGLAGLLLLALRATERADAERMGQDFVTSTRVRLLRRIVRRPARSRSGDRLGLTLTRLTTDLSSLKNWVSQGVARSAVAAIVLPGGIVALAWFSWLGAGVGLGLVLVCVASAVAIAPSLRDRVREARRLRGRLASHLGEQVRVADTTWQFGRVEQELRRVRVRSRRLADALVRRMRLAGALRSLPDAAFPLGAALLVVLGRGETREDLLASVLLLGILTSKLRDAVRALDHRLAFAEARARIEQLLSAPALREVRDAVALEGEGAAALRFEGVCVDGVLEQVDLEALPGERVFVTGASGSGKSTLLALAARRFDPDRGSVRLGDAPLASSSLASVRRSVHLVSPAVPLLRGTVGSNLAYASGGADPGHVAQVAAFCEIDTESLGLPVGEAGRDVPDGLRARASLARALLARARVLLVDDPAFRSDAAAARVLERVLATADATVLVAASEDASQAGADRVWELCDGRVRELRPQAASPAA
ncbi:MAG: ATP-binding cassette domain-containing protein [Myxococcota bacterium]